MEAAGGRGLAVSIVVAGLLAIVVLATVPLRDTKKKGGGQKGVQFHIWVKDRAGKAMSEAQVRYWIADDGKLLGEPIELVEKIGLLTLTPPLSHGQYGFQAVSPTHGKSDVRLQSVGETMKGTIDLELTLR